MCDGVSYIANCHGKANKKYVNEYDEKALSKYIIYLDTNNIYGWAVSLYLPTGGFTEKEMNNIDFAKYKEDGKRV